MSCAIFTRATSALSPAWGGCRHVLTSPGGVQLGLTSCVCPPPPHTHTLPPPQGAPRPQQLLPLFCPLCQTRSQNIYKHAKGQTFPRAPERRPSARDPAAVHARVRTRYPSVLLGAPSDVYAPFSPPQSHRVTRPGGDVTCTESASRSEQRQRPDWKVSPPLRVGPSGSAGGEGVSQLDVRFPRIPEVFLCKASAD